MHGQLEEMVNIAFHSAFHYYAAAFFSVVVVYKSKSAILFIVGCAIAAFIAYHAHALADQHLIVQRALDVVHNTFKVASVAGALASIYVLARSG